MSENGNSPELACKHGRGRRGLIGVVAAIAAMLSFSLIGIVAASAAAPAGGHFVASSHGGGGGNGGGGGGGTWDQTKVPLPHLPGQAPVFFIVQSQTVADVVALDQTSEPAADASMVAFYQNNTACAVARSGMPSVQYVITCPHGSATTTDALSGGTWIHVFRLVK